ncbi:MAG: AAA family ATPase [Actinobacteria bacterium]|uniref:DNA 3'-5' helicase n=1 Tax=freshwater metagenome TaxID=449393 RepID=A0A6J6E9B5_9ZZZZ|nr:AAA family ATPase [Actinomycetota bacterium]
MSAFKEIYTPAQVAAFIQRVDPKFHKPSDHQSKIISIIENPLEPAVVIAGAGSGKTETMAARVVYLVANQVVAPHQVLGLTFTRKAAGELNIRIRKRLKQLSQGMKEAGEPVHFENFDTSVTTYHSYAGRILSEHAIRLGIDADSSPMGEAALWMLANRIVQTWDKEGFTYESAPNTVVEDLMGLTSQALEHQVTGEEIIAEDQRLIEKLATMGGALNDGVRTADRTARQRIALVEMMNHFINERRTSGELSFDDQIALAATIAEKFPDVSAIERTKYPVVLLDEYQDTSHSQVRLLSTLFGGGHAVTAVGDPCQSIYTWRGAAAGTIGAFNKYFPKGPGATGPTQFDLLETFRNDIAILDTANLISAEVRNDKKIVVPPLTARKDAGPGNLVCGIFENLEAEAQAIVEYFSPLWGADGVKTSDLSFAVLVRKKSQIPIIQSALTAAGIRSEVLGLGGLIHVPEVADIVALLKVIDSPDAGGALMRHLTGPRINLGPRDIAALGRFSSSQARADSIDNRSIVKNIIAGNPMAAEGDDQFTGSLIDALDEIEKANRSTFSPAGYARLSQFSADLRRLRSRASGPITDLILEIERYLNLDSEVALREEGIHGRRHLDRFLDEANKFARSGGSLHAFLTWLDVASKAESGLKAGAPDVDKSVVQILTIHMSKGAEWDVVAIPGLTNGTFPSDSSRSPENWTTNERFIPFALRRDNDVVPQLSFGLADTNKAASDALKSYGDDCVKYRRGEEIRLGYVAVTRAKSHLFASASHWGGGKKPLRASSLYRKIEEIALAQGRVIDELEAPDDEDRNPRADDENSAIWPRDPLGDRRSTFDAQVEKVRSAKVVDLEKLESRDSVLQSWIEDARAIIAEVAESRRTSNEIPRPVRMSPSSIIAMKRNPSEFARNIRRPMPRARDEYSSRGTAFHLWIEHHLKGSSIYSEEDFDLLQPIEEDRSLEDLKSAWLKSEWADRRIRSEDIEVPFETVIAGTLVRGRIDAVYRTDSGFEVIDWKTGSKQLDEDAAIQLAIYRLAFAKLEGVPVESITAAFHYVPTGVTDRRDSLLSEAELNTLLQ